MYESLRAPVQREEERKKDGSKVIEVRRQPNTGQGGERRNRDRGARTSIDKNGHDRSAGKGTAPNALFCTSWPSQVCDGFSEGAACLVGRSQQAKHEEEPAPIGAAERDSVATDEPKSAPVPEPSSQRCVII